jgi:glycosyltransferase involved in cell wall biosynthesis
MKIGIDCRLSGIAHAGIGRYIENLISRLPKEASDIEWVYFYRNKKQVIPNLNVESHLVPIQHYTFQEQLQLVSIFNQAKLDLLHVPHFNAPILYPGKLIVTIHDLLWHQQRGSQVTTLKPWEYWGKYTGYKLVTSRAIKKASKILVPTQTIKKTLSRHYPDSIDKIIVTHEGVDNRLLKFKNKKVKKQPQSLIYVGSLYPHKNIRLVVKALQKLPGWKLTIVGSRNVFQDKIKEEIKKLGVEKQTEFTGYLSDEDLAQEIKAATALVQPSLSEGFGLTGIEAMALGTSVVASDIPVFKEIYQNAAVYFDPHSVENFVKNLANLSKKKPSKKQMSAVVKQYSWDEMTKKTIKAYKSLL